MRILAEKFAIVQVDKKTSYMCQGGKLPLTFDFLYMPASDFKTGERVGYVFVDFCSGDAAVEARNRLHGVKEASLADRHPLSVGRATLQGFAANVEKWKASRHGRIRNPNLRPIIVD